MVKAAIFRDPAGEPVGFSLEGHAGFARKGKDIVCAAVSALAIGTVNGIEQLTEARFSLEEGKNGGRLVFRLKEPSAEAGLLLSSFFLAVEEIRKEYGGRYIQISSKEVDYNENGPSVLCS